MFAPLRIKTPNPTPEPPEYSSEDALQIAYAYDEAVNSIGRGAYGHVKKVIYEGESYAVKYMRIHSRRKFMKEVENHKYLSEHPDTTHYVPKYIGYVIMKQYGYLIQSYVHSMDFMRFLELGRTFSKAIGERIFHELIEAVQAFHSVGALHNDIKPENILLLLDESDHPNGHIRLIDFDTMCTLPCSITNSIGTNAYWPEFVKENSSLRFPYNTVTENYSLGIVLRAIVDSTEGMNSEKKAEIARNYLDPGVQEYRLSLIHI